MPNNAVAENFKQNFIPPPELDLSFIDNINYLEFVAACVAILVWVPGLAGGTVLIESDNSSNVSFFQRSTSKNIAAVVG